MWRTNRILKTIVGIEVDLGVSLDQEVGLDLNQGRGVDRDRVTFLEEMTKVVHVIRELGADREVQTTEGIKVQISTLIGTIAVTVKEEVTVNTRNNIVNIQALDVGILTEEIMETIPGIEDQEM